MSTEPATPTLVNRDLLPVQTSQPWYDRFISRNAKALAALVIGGLTWGAVVVHSPAHAIGAEEWLQLGGTIAAALGVYGATNSPK